MTRYADKTSYAEDSQSSGHVDLHRAVRSAPAFPAGEAGNVRRGTRRSEWSAGQNSLQMGIGGQCAGHRKIPATCGGTWNQASDTLTGRLKKEFSVFFSKIRNPLLTILIFENTISRVNQNGSPNQVRASSFRPVLIDVKTMRKAGLLPLTT